MPYSLPQFLFSPYISVATCGVIHCPQIYGHCGTGRQPNVCMEDRWGLCRKYRCLYSFTALSELLKSSNDKICISKQEFSNLASDWLSVQLPANRKLCQKILVNYQIDFDWFFSVTQTTCFPNILKLAQMNLIKVGDMITISFILAYYHCMKSLKALNCWKHDWVLALQILKPWC